MASTERQRGFEARRLRVAGLVIVGLVLLVFAVYRVGKIFDVFATRYSLVTLLPTVSGLAQGAPVTLAGEQVGQVADIRFIPMHLKRGGNNLIVRMKIADRVRTQIRRDSRVVIRPQGLLGDKYMDIEPGTLRTAMLHEGDTIPSTVEMDIEQFMAQASQLLDQTGTLVADLGNITHGLARGEGTMGQLLHDTRLYNQMTAATGQLSSLLNDINNGRGTLGHMIHDPAMYDRMVGAFTRVDSLGSLVLHGNGTLSLLLRNDSLYRGLAGTAANANTAAAHFSEMLQKFNSPDGSLNKFMTDPRLFDEFLKSVLDLQALLADVRQNPKKYVPPVNVKVF